MLDRLSDERRAESELRLREQLRKHLSEEERAAIGAAKKQPGVDPERIILWGVSQSGGHALTVAADRTDVAAVIAVVPLVNGLAAGRVAYAQVGGAAIAR